MSVLHNIKDEHEAWVKESLAPTSPQTDAAEYLYADLVDLISLELLDSWSDITLGPMSPAPFYQHRNIEKIRAFRERTLRTPWPRLYPTFENAAIRLGFVLTAALEHFQVHSNWAEFFERSGTTIWADKFYKHARSEVEYRALSNEYDAWVQRLHELMQEATKAANWLSDCIRAHINPRFRLVEGYVLASEDQGLSVSRVLYRYTPSEAEAVSLDPYGHLDRAMTWFEQYQERATGDATPG